MASRGAPRKEPEAITWRAAPMAFRSDRSSLVATLIRLSRCDTARRVLLLYLTRGCCTAPEVLAEEILWRAGLWVGVAGFEPTASSSRAIRSPVAEAHNRGGAVDAGRYGVLRVGTVAVFRCCTAGGTWQRTARVDQRNDRTGGHTRAAVTSTGSAVRWQRYHSP
jgi:hypothetical protein